MNQRVITLYGNVAGDIAEQMDDLVVHARPNLRDNEIVDAITGFQIVQGAGHWPLAAIVVVATRKPIPSEPPF